MSLYGKEQLLLEHMSNGRDLQLPLLLHFTFETLQKKLMLSVAPALIYELHKPASCGAYV